MKNLKLKIIFFLISILALSIKFLGFTIHVKADANIDGGFVYLKSQQDDTGRIKNGFSAPSQWSAIAFAANGIDISGVKKSTNSLRDFLLSDIPIEPSAATDWENKILAIVAINENPSNFGTINYVDHLQSFYNNGQIGDICTLNDDIFGLLALIASGNTANTQIKQDVLQFLISKQDTTDGGFGYSAPGCKYYSTASDMTAAAIQALQAAKDNGLENSNLEDAIIKAKNYLFLNQDSDGGFGYGSSDSDTTGWVLMALNVLGMQDSDQAKNARTWLIAQKSTVDGGFTACDKRDSITYACIDYASNSTTTANALIGISGKGWLIKIFDNSSSTPTPTPTDAPPSPSPTPTLTSSSNSNTATNNPTPTLTPVPTSVSTPTPTKVLLAVNQLAPIQSGPTEAVLGSSTTTDVLSPTPALSVKVSPTSLNWSFLSKLLIGLGIILFITCGILIVKRYKELK